MKSATIIVTGEGSGMREALAMTETIGTESGLERKNLLHLRLLSEELFGMLRGIAGKVEAGFWLAVEGKRFELHMKSDVKLTSEIRDQFLAAASSGKNEATKSFMGKIRAMIAGAMLSAKEALPYAMMNTAAAYPMGGYPTAGDVVWSLAGYKNTVRQHVNDDEAAKEAWDELEKSIVANIADDVKVKIVGKTVEITVLKAF